MGQPADPSKRWSTKAKGPRKSTRGPRKPVVDQSSWRVKIRQNYIKFDDNAKRVYCEALAEHGVKTAAAGAAGVCMTTVNKHAANDPEFQEAEQAALETYNGSMLLYFKNLVFKGVQRPIIGGKDRDEVVAYETIISPQLVAMEVKRVDPEYRDKQSIDLTGNGGGVLVVPAGVSPEEWVKQQEEKNLDKTAPPELKL